MVVFATNIGFLGFRMMALFLLGAMMQGQQVKALFDSPEIGGTIVKILGYFFVKQLRHRKIKFVFYILFTQKHCFNSARFVSLPRFQIYNKRYNTIKMVNNDYLGCDFYQNQAKDANTEGFVTFFDKKEAKYYFALVNPTDGKVILRSEGYPTEKAQQIGIASVTKNKVEEKQYSIVEDAKAFFIVLKAKNKVEIARSCPFTTKVAAENGILTLLGKETPSTTKAIKEEKTIAAKTTTTAIAKETTTKKVETKVTTTAPKAVKKANVTTEFESAELFLGHETLEDEFGKTGFALFQAENKHYFVVYNQDGSIFQRSLGFDSTVERDNMFFDLKNAIINESAYQIIENDAAFQVQLKNEKGNIISSSTTFMSYTEAFMKTPKGWTKPTEMVGMLY